jgi:DNA-binding response OmpR family regulator
VLTATRDRGAAERALALGAVDCFRKPFEVEALRARVRELIS